MHFGLSEEQLELSRTVRTLLERRSNPLAVRRAIESEHGYDVELWRVLSEEVGAAALAIPEEYGGAGFSSFETHLVLEELGYALTPSPMFGSAVLAAEALLLAEDNDACERLLPSIANGTSVAALAWADSAGKWRTNGSDISATQQDGWRLSGLATLVLDGAHADVLIAVANTDDGARLFEVMDGDGVERIATPALDPTLRLASVRFDSAAARPLGNGDADLPGQLRDRALVATTALQVGAARRGLDMTVRYSKDRVQFGRQIGSFQAVKHRMADMLIQVETSRTLSWSAAWAAANNSLDLPAQAAMAKAWCSDALDFVSSETVQLHGGIAITWEHDAQLVFKRAHALSHLFGQAAEHRGRLYELKGLASR